MAKKKAAKAKAPAPRATAPARARVSEPKEPAGPTMIKVRALQDLYVGDKYHRTGDVLHVPEKDLHPKLHEEVDPRTPEKITSSGEALAKERQATLASRAASKGLTAPIDNPTGAADVFGEQTKRPE